MGRLVRTFSFSRSLLLILGVFGALAAAPPSPAPTPAPPSPAVRSAAPLALRPDTPAWLAAHGVRVSAGAAPGFVDDAICGSCHAGIATAYAGLGMGRSFYRPRRQGSPEAFGVPFEHAPSRRVYEMVWRGEQLVFRRWQVGARGERVNEVEQPVDWVLGSGNHARTYLFRNPAGELWQLPIAWYSQEGRWGMAPGYDRADHDELSRQVQRECLVCHNAFAEVPAGTDTYGMPHRFPAALPEGIGCQRCHGPGAEHVRRAQSPDAWPGESAAGIVNPARLSPERRAEVCYQCHLQPAVAMPAVRRFDRGDHSFRPGEPLAAHRVDLDPLEEGRQRSDRFEIVNQGYRLQQSRCFTASGAALTCLTCHSPHRKLPASERAAHYRSVCLSCHTAEQCREPTHAASADCTTCHMPARRTEDVVRVVMTDHRIQVPRAGVDLVAPREEHDPVLVGVELLRPAEAPPARQGEIYRAIGVLRSGGARDAVPYLARLFAADPPLDAEAWLRLAVGQLRVQSYSEAEVAVRRALTAPGGDTPLAHVWLALSFAGQRRLDAALGELALASSRDPDLVEARFNRGRLLLSAGRTAEALPALERAVALRPTFAAGWLRVGEAKEVLGRRTEAIADYRRVLAIEPSTTDGYIALARALRAQGDAKGATEALALGARFARRPEALAAPETEPAPDAPR